MLPEYEKEMNTGPSTTVRNIEGVYQTKYYDSDKKSRCSFSCHFRLIKNNVNKKNSRRIADSNFDFCQAV